MLSLVKFCFNDDSNKQEEINEILKVISIDNTTTPFSIHDKVQKYLKSNSIPATFPDEHFSFKFHTIRMKTDGNILEKRLKKSPYCCTI